LSISLVAAADGKVVGHVALLSEPEYYSRFGFQAEPSLVLPDLTPEYFQAISFNSPLPCGTVSYEDSFSAQK